MRPALGGSQAIDIGSEGGDLSIYKDQFNVVIEVTIRF